MKKNISISIKTSILCALVAGCGTTKLDYVPLTPSSTTTEISLRRFGAFSASLDISTNLSSNEVCEPLTRIGSLNGDETIIVAPTNKPIHVFGMITLRHAGKLTSCGPMQKVFTAEKGINYSIRMDVTEKICMLKINAFDNGKLISEVEGEAPPKCQPTKLNRP